MALFRRREQPDDQLVGDDHHHQQQHREPEVVPESVLLSASEVIRRANRADGVGRQGLTPPTAWRGAHGDGGWMWERW
jgi:hypothetical protein